MANHTISATTSWVAGDTITRGGTASAVFMTVTLPSAGEARVRARADASSTWVDLAGPVTVPSDTLSVAFSVVAVDDMRAEVKLDSGTGTATVRWDQIIVG